MEDRERRLEVAKLVPPPPEATTRSSVVLPDWMWERLAAIASEHKHTETRRYTRDEIIRHFLDWAIQEYGRAVKDEGDKKGR